MASQRIKFTVGLFVTTGIVLSLVAVIWLGMSRFLEKGKHYVIYFNESVQGLNIDSPVKYRGVSIGRVERIGVAPDSKLIEVVIKIESDMKLGPDMVAQLKPVGITGSMFIEIDRKKRGEPDLTPKINFPTEYPVVASKPSEIRRIIQGIDDVIKQIGSIDFEGISKKTNLILDNLNRISTEADIKGISRDIRASLNNIKLILNPKKINRIMDSMARAGESINHLMKMADSRVEQVGGTLNEIEATIRENRKNIRDTVSNISTATKKINEILDSGSHLVKGTETSIQELKGYLIIISRNLDRASQGINQLIETLNTQPLKMLTGEAPSEREKQSQEKE